MSDITRRAVVEALKDGPLTAQAIAGKLAPAAPHAETITQRELERCQAAGFVEQVAGPHRGNRSAGVCWYLASEAGAGATIVVDTGCGHVDVEVASASQAHAATVAAMLATPTEGLATRVWP